MYRCNYCKQEFDEPDTHREYHSEVDCSEYWECCPYCGEANFEEVNEEEEENDN